jgi:hypothetical protein
MNAPVLNMAALSELLSHVRALSRILDEIIENNPVDDCYIFSSARSAVDRSKLSSDIPVSKEVYNLLLRVGKEGMTSGEVLRQLEMRRSVTWAAVRQAMYRLKATGKARRVGRLWYPVL